jgi:hypothetical protein
MAAAITTQKMTLPSIIYGRLIPYRGLVFAYFG